MLVGAKPQTKRDWKCLPFMITVCPLPAIWGQASGNKERVGIRSSSDQSVIDVGRQVSESVWVNFWQSFLSVCDLGSSYLTFSCLSFLTYLMRTIVYPPPQRVGEVSKYVGTPMRRPGPGAPKCQLLPIATLLCYYIKLEYIVSSASQ